jgi:hypothetical protein
VKNSRGTGRRERTEGTEPDAFHSLARSIESTNIEVGAKESCPESGLWSNSISSNMVVSDFTKKAKRTSTYVQRMTFDSVCVQVENYEIVYDIRLYTIAPMIALCSSRVYLTPPGQKLLLIMHLRYH